MKSSTGSAVFSATSRAKTSRGAAVLTGIILSDIINPYLNLALEEILFQRLTEGHRLLLLSRNSSSVVIGRFQNSWLEAPVEQLSRNGIPLLRRISGGGTVYHDLGNSNVSFMAYGQLYDQDENYRLLLQALADLGIPAEKNERNDIIVGSKKISGSAFKKTSRGSMHHCTVLLRADLTKLQAALTRTQPAIDAKGTRSVPSPVMNCSDIVPGIDHDTLCSALIHRFRGDSAGAVRHFSEEQAFSDKEIHRRYTELQSWEWIFGKNPPFEQPLIWRYAGGSIAFRLIVRKCRIDGVEGAVGAESRGAAAAVQHISSVLQGIPYRREAVTGALQQDDTLLPGLTVEEQCLFFRWLSGQIYFS